jgi:hypothetical protein
LKRFRKAMRMVLFEYCKKKKLETVLPASYPMDTGGSYPEIKTTRARS